MKLFELINTPVKHVTTNRPIAGDPKDKSDRGSRSSKSTNIGRGVFSSVEHHPNLPPGAVVKYGRVYGGDRVEADGYVNFLKMLTKNDRMSRNPYLPRVYSVKVINSNQYVVVMEKLYKFSEVTPPELEAMIDKMFGGIDQLRLSHKGITVHHSDRSRLVTQTLHNVVEGTVGVDIIVDPLLKQAVMLIKHICRGENVADIHGGNVMIRRGPTGAQLVITDPIV